MEDAVWLEISIDTAEEALDDLCARLTMNGATGLVIEDEEDFKSFLEQNRQYWDYVDEALLEQMKGAARVKFYVTDDPDGEAQRKKWMAGIDLPYTAVRLRENDWATSWQKYYRPPGGGGEAVYHPGLAPDAPAPEGRIPLYLDPGLAFGTGNHASTRLCLEWVEELVRPGEGALDLGCGSGILSIAALLLGCGSAAGVDIDPKAVDVAYENAALNGIGRDRYTVLAGDVIGDPSLRRELAARKYGLVMANIVADVIIPLAPHVKELLAPGGTFLCSGIIDTRCEEVRAALEANGLNVLGRKDRDGWVAYAARPA